MFKFLCRTEVHFRTTVLAEQQSRKHTNFSFPCGSAFVFTQFLNQRKSFSVNNGRVGVFKYYPIFFRDINLCFVLEGLGCTSEINGIPNILLAFKNIRYTGLCPFAFYFGWDTAIPADTVPILCGSRYLLFGQLPCYLRGTKSCNTHLKDFSYHLCGRLVNQPFLFVFRIFHISERRIGCQRHTGHTFALEHVSHLLTCILCVPFVEQILHWNNIADAFCGVDIIHNSNIPNTQAVKFFFKQLSYNESVSAKTGMVFYNEVFNLALFRHFHYLGEGRSCKTNA